MSLLIIVVLLLCKTFLSVLNEGQHVCKICHSDKNTFRNSTVQVESIKLMFNAKCYALIYNLCDKHILL